MNVTFICESCILSIAQLLSLVLDCDEIVANAERIAIFAFKN